MSEKDFYKKIHPDLFSDSKVVKKGKLSKDFFSYFLESLTSQSKEKEFEDFCRKIIEKTICPNLLPQTGPTGGGDSKVDSETFPVSESLAENWLYGYGDSAHKERWAFAISAKKDWKPKIKSDVKKIIKTNEDHGRKYTKIFFITNQFVSDKKRADTEDDLRKEYQLDIRILDRTWLLDNTFYNDNQKLAIKAFNMSDSLDDVVEEGVRDANRKKRLKEIDEELKNIESLNPARIIKLSEESVEILRELEVDKSIAVNVLERNIRFSQKYGGIDNYANALYEYCWTILWWYEDRDKHYEMYKELENVYKENSDNYQILKKLSTLWITIFSNHKAGKRVIDDMDLHTQLLVDSFEIFIQDNENPNRARLAKYEYQMMRMQTPELWSNVVESYIEVLQDMNFNNNIDLFQLKRVLELPILKNCPKYDELFETLINLLGEESKNVASSQLLINRGDDYMERDIYVSIKLYSRALTKLYHETSKVDLIQTFLKLGVAFEEIGLLWSARSYYIRAFMDSFNLYFDNGSAIPSLFLSMRSLKYLELRLGRINYSLQFNELELNVRGFYPYKMNDEKEWEKYTHYDGLLAIAILNVSLCDIGQYESLPDYLDISGLEMSTAALKYKLGYYDEDFVEALGSKHAIDELMLNLFKQPASIEFQNRLDTKISEEKVKLKTKILGCNVIINAKRKVLIQELSATVLAMLENIFATSTVDGMFPMLSEFTINIHERKGDHFDIAIEQEDNKLDLVVYNIVELTEYRNRSTVSEKLNSVVSMFIAQMVSVASNLEKLRKSVEEENAMFRSLNCSSTLDTFIANDQDFTSLDEKTKKLGVYKNIRIEDIFKDEELKVDRNIDNNNSVEKIHFGEPPEMIDFSKVHHDKIKVSNIIYPPLWDNAKWKGLFVLSDQNFQYPPFIGLVFENRKGIDIFNKWKAEFKVDKIVIGIITGIDKNNPNWYRVIIGEDVHSSFASDKTISVVNQMCRLHTMEAKNDENIKLLKKAIRKQKKFNLIPILIEDLECGRLRRELSLNKKCENIIIKDVSEIEEKDIFLINGLTPFDKPVNKTGKELFAEKIINEKQRYKHS